MLICKDCRCYHPVSVSDRYCGECCIGETRNPIEINADITGCCLFEPKQPKKKLTNADRIRQMTDEELCDFMAESICDNVDVCINDTPCRECRLAWLKQEAKDDAT